MMMSHSLRPTLLGLALLAASPVQACSSAEGAMTDQTASESASRVATVEEVYGLWSIRDGDSRCRVALSAVKSGVGHQASVERCAIPALADGAGWRPVAGGFELLGPGDRVLGRFRMTGVDGFESMDGKLKGERAAEM
jgi:hypothetical protein